MTRPRLLLIDDEPALADVRGQCRRDDAASSPIIAERRQQFRDEFHAAAPGMVALDLGMPGMDGVELLRFLADRGIRRARC